MRDLVHELLTHYGDLHRQLTRDLKDPHYAADIAQSSFERVYAQAVQQGSGGMVLPAEAMCGIESPRALLFRVARNLCIDDARKRKVAQEWCSHHPGVDMVQTTPSSEYVVAQQRVLARVVEALEQFPPRRREVFILFRAHGYTRAEIAAQLEITEMAVAKHLARAVIDCARVLTELRHELIEPQYMSSNRSVDARLAEDLS